VKIAMLFNFSEVSAYRVQLDDVVGTVVRVGHSSFPPVIAENMTNTNALGYHQTNNKFPSI
jgi:hypothetical protein